MADVNENPKNKVALMFDSGVFSAWSHGEDVSMEEYIEYLKANKKHLFSYVTMDSVPDASSTTGDFPTREETKRSAAKSYANQQAMKEHGLAPIPVFHQGEPFSYLERYIKDGEDYIGISPWKTNITVAAQRAWFDEVYSVLTDQSGKPIVRTHGFGVSSPNHLLRYPFWTVDSTTWVLSAGFGKVFIPHYKHGEPDYSKPPMSIIMSNRETSSKASQKLQFANLGEQMQLHVERYLAEVVGVSISEARNIPEARRRACLIYFNDFCEHLHDRRFTHKKGGFMQRANFKHKHKALKEVWNTRLMFATNLSRKFSHVLGGADANNRLLSYFELRDKPVESLIEYVKTGIIGGPYVQKPPPASWTLESYLVYRYQGFLNRQAELEKEDAA